MRHTARNAFCSSLQVSPIPHRRPTGYVGSAKRRHACCQALTPGSRRVTRLTDEEGHADNIAAAVYGGFQVNFRSSFEGHARSGQWITQRVSVPAGLQCVLFIPDEEHVSPTSLARGVLPELYSRADAIHNIGRAAMLINWSVRRATRGHSRVHVLVDARTHAQGHMRAHARLQHM